MGGGEAGVGERNLHGEAVLPAGENVRMRSLLLYYFEFHFKLSFCYLL